MKMMTERKNEFKGVTGFSVGDIVEQDVEGVKTVGKVVEIDKNGLIVSRFGSLRESYFDPQRCTLLTTRGNS